MSVYINSGVVLSELEIKNRDTLLISRRSTLTEYVCYLDKRSCVFIKTWTLIGLQELVSQ